MWKLSTQNVFLCPHPKLPALRIESLKHLTEDKMLSAHEFWPYREIEKGVPHLHPRWHADSGQVRGAAGSSHWSAPSWWAPLLLVVQHHGATSGAAGTWGTTVPLLLTRPAAASSSQPLGPALLIIHRSPSCPPPAGPSWPGWACPAWEPSWSKRQRLSRVIHVYRIRLFGVVLQSFILEINS